MAAKHMGTDGDNSWTVVQAATFTLDGLGGVDTINFGTSLRSAYTIVANADGSVNIDTVSAASAALHATLYNVEILTFNDGTDTLDLRTYFADTTAPLLTGSSLDSGGAAVAVDARLVFTFNEAIKLGSGAIVLKSSSGAVLETFDAAHSTGVSISGNTLTLTPGAYLANSTQYHVQIGEGALVDMAGNRFKGMADLAFLTLPPAVLQGSDGNDRLHASAGSNAIDGGAGTDTVVYALPSAGVAITRSGASVIVTQAGSSDMLNGVERLAFADKTIAMDIDGVGGAAYRLYQAAFNRVPDEAGLGFWIGQMDKGLSLQDVAAAFVGAPEFERLVGPDPDNRALVDNFYHNVLHRYPDAGGYAYWLGILDSGAATPAQLLVAFSESPENQAALVGTIGNGFSFIPFAG
ncbi:MAG: DUF4214 domain-containing protein [Telluria sp.]